MLTQIAAGVLAFVPEAPSAFLAPVSEWCWRSSSWNATQVVPGAYVWTIHVHLSYGPSPATLRIFADLDNGTGGPMISLYLPLPYPCVPVDPTASFAIVNWMDPAIGWLHASIVKPPGLPWPEAIEEGVVVLVVM